MLKKILFVCSAISTTIAVLANVFVLKGKLIILALITYLLQLLITLIIIMMRRQSKKLKLKLAEQMDYKYDVERKNDYIKILFKLFKKI